MDRAIAIFVFLLVFTVGAILVAPSSVDWNQYRYEIESYAEYLTGRDVSIDGDIEFVLLPYPALTMANFAVANSGEASDNKMISLQRLELRAALRPLIMGDIQITDFRMVKPQIALEVLAGNTTNWRLDESERGEAPVQREWPWWLSALVNALKFDIVTIQDGTLTYSDATRGVLELVRELNGTFSADTINGPFRADGTAVLRGVDLRFDWSVGDTSVVRAVPARLNATFMNSDATVAFKGFLEEASLFGVLSGELGFTGPDARSGLNDLFRLIRGGPVAEPKGTAAKLLAQDLTVQMNLKIAGANLTAKDLVLGLGGIRAKGSISARIGRQPEFQAHLSARRINLDSLLKKNSKQTRSVNLNKAAQSIQSELEGFILPINLVGKIDIKIDGIIYRAGAIQDFVLEGYAKDGQIEVRQASGRLPGRAALTGQGVWSPANGGTSFNGSFAFETENPQATLNWLGFDVRKVDSDLLSQLKVSADFETSPSKFYLRESVLELDGETLNGDFSHEVGDRERFDLRLSASTLDMDAYAVLIPNDEPWAAWQFPPWQNEELEAEDYDTGVVVKADRLILNGNTLTNVDIDLLRSNDRLIIDHFAVEDIEGVQVALAGEFTSFFPQPKFALTGRLESNSLNSMLRFLGFDAAASAASGGRTVMTLDGALTPEDGVVELTVVADGSGGERVEVAGLLKRGVERYELDIASTGPDGSWIKIKGSTDTVTTISDFNLTAQVAAGDFTRFAQSYGFDVITKDQKPAPVDLMVRLDVAEDRFQLTEFEGSIGEASIIARGTLLIREEKRNFDGDVKLVNFEADRFGIAESMALPSTNVQSSEDVAALERQLFGDASSGEDGAYDWLKAFDGALKIAAENVSRGRIEITSATATMTIEEGAILIRDLEVDMFGGTLSGQVTYATADLLPELGVNLTAKNVEFTSAIHAFLGIDRTKTPIDGVADFSAQVAALGRTSATLLSSMNGSLTIASSDGEFRGFDLVAFNDRLNKSTSLEDYRSSVVETLTSGTTSYENLYGELNIEDGMIVAASGEDPQEEPFLAMLARPKTTDEQGIGTLTLLGELDLTLGIINGEGVIRLEGDGEAPPIKIRLTGPYDEPDRQIESASMGAFYVDDFAARANNIEKTETDRQINAFREGIQRLETKTQE